MSELKIRFSCMINDLYTARVLSNGLGGFSFGARSCWAIEAASCSATAVGVGARAARR